MDERTAKRVLGPVWRRLRLLLSRGVLKLIEDGGGLQSVQVTLLGDKPAWAERFQNYGTTSHPLPGAEAAVAAVGGARAHLVALAVDDRRYRIASLQPGEVTLYDDQGQRVHLTRDGIVIDGAGKPVAFVNCPTVTMDGDLFVAGEVRDHTNTMQDMRDAFNPHTHGGAGPDRSMG